MSLRQAEHVSWIDGYGPFHGILPNRMGNNDKKGRNDGYRGTLAGASRPQLVGVSLQFRAIVADVLEITKEACLVFAARAH